MVRKIVLRLAALALLMGVSFYTGCGPDPTHLNTSSTYNTIATYFNNWAPQDITVVKCDSIDVTSSYKGFLLSLVQQADSSNYYVFKYVTENGTPAFRVSGKIFFNKDSVVNAVVYGFRDDRIKVAFIKQPKNEYIKIYGNADCSNHNGRTMVGKGTYLFKD